MFLKINENEKEITIYGCNINKKNQILIKEAKEIEDLQLKELFNYQTPKKFIKKTLKFFSTKTYFQEEIELL